jgi:opacity protein-like surface antigen
MRVSTAVSAATAINIRVAGTSNLNSSGFFGGGQIGYNWQFAPAWVAGVEADIDDADIQGIASTSASGLSSSIGTRLDWFGTVRGRVGYLVTPTALFYGTGGWAYGRTTSSASISAGGLGAGASVGNTQTGGWTAGAGLEYAFNPRVSFKTEYLFVTSATRPLQTASQAACRYRSARRRPSTPSRSASTSSSALGVLAGAYNRPAEIHTPDVMAELVPAISFSAITIVRR